MNHVTEVTDDILKRHIEHELGFFKSEITKGAHSSVRLGGIFKLEEEFEDVPIWDISDPDQYKALIDALKNTQPIIFNTEGEIASNFLMEAEERDRGQRELLEAQRKTEDEIRERDRADQIKRFTESMTMIENIRRELLMLEEKRKIDQLRWEEEQKRIKEEKRRIAEAIKMEEEKKRRLEEERIRKEAEEKEKLRLEQEKLRREKEERIERFKQEMNIRVEMEEKRKNSEEQIIRNRLSRLEEEKKLIEKNKNERQDTIDSLKETKSQIERRLNQLENDKKKMTIAIDTMRIENERALQESIKKITVESDRMMMEEEKDREAERRRNQQYIEEERKRREEEIIRLDEEISSILNDFRKKNETDIKTLEDKKRKEDEKKRLLLGQVKIEESSKQQEKIKDLQHQQERDFLEKDKEKKIREAKEASKRSQSLVEEEIKNKIKQSELSTVEESESLKKTQDRLANERKSKSRQDSEIIRLQENINDLKVEVMESKKDHQLKLKEINEVNEIQLAEQENIYESIVQRRKREVQNSIKKRNDLIRMQTIESNESIQTNISNQRKLDEELRNSREKKRIEDQKNKKMRKALLEKQMTESMEIETDLYKDVLLNSAYELNEGKKFEDIEAGIYEWKEKMKIIIESKEKKGFEIYESILEPTDDLDSLSEASRLLMLNVKGINDISYTILNDEISAAKMGLKFIIDNFKEPGIKSNHLRAWRRLILDKMRMDFNDPEMKYPEVNINPAANYVYEVTLSMELHIHMQKNLKFFLMSLLSIIKDLKENHKYNALDIFTGAFAMQEVMTPQMKYLQRKAILINLAVKYLLYALELQKHCITRIRHLLIRFYYCRSFFEIGDKDHEIIFQMVKDRYVDFGMWTSEKKNMFGYGKLLTEKVIDIEKSKKTVPFIRHKSANYNILSKLLASYLENTELIEDRIFYFLYDKKHMPRENGIFENLKYLNSLLFLKKMPASRESFMEWLKNWSVNKELNFFVANKTQFYIDIISNGLLKYVYGRESTYPFVKSIRDLTIGDVLNTNQGVKLNKLIRGDLNNLLLLQIRKCSLDWDLFALASLNAHINIHRFEPKKSELSSNVHKNSVLKLLNARFDGGEIVKSEFLLRTITELILLHVKLNDNIKEGKKIFNTLSIYIQNPFNDKSSKMRAKTKRKKEKDTNKKTQILPGIGFTLKIAEDYQTKFVYIRSLVDWILKTTEQFKIRLTKNDYGRMLEELNKILRAKK